MKRNVDGNCSFGRPKGQTGLDLIHRLDGWKGKQVPNTTFKTAAVIGAMIILTAPVFGMPHWVNDKSHSSKNGAEEATGHNASEFNDRNSAAVTALESSDDRHHSSQLLSMLRGASGIIDGFATVLTALTSTDQEIESERHGPESATSNGSPARLALGEEGGALLGRLKARTADYWGRLGGLVVVGVAIVEVPS